MRVLSKECRMKTESRKPSRSADRRQNATPVTRLAPRDRKREDTKKSGWHNWLMEENYL
jgi:hypothetical protein